MVHYFFGEKNEGVIYCILVGEYFADLEERKKKSVSFQKFINLQNSNENRILHFLDQSDLSILIS
jgi:hypothetical protein